jgi:hypothetical protein
MINKNIPISKLKYKHAKRSSHQAKYKTNKKKKYKLNGSKS